MRRDTVNVLIWDEVSMCGFYEINTTIQPTTPPASSTGVLCPAPEIDQAKEQTVPVAARLAHDASSVPDCPGWLGVDGLRDGARVGQRCDRLMHLPVEPSTCGESYDNQPTEPPPVSRTVSYCRQRAAADDLSVAPGTSRRQTHGGGPGRPRQDRH